MWDPARLGQASEMHPAMRPMGLGGSVPMSRNPALSGAHGNQIGPRLSAPSPWAAQAGPRGMPVYRQMGEVQQGMGVRPGQNMMGGPAVAPPGQPSLQDIQAEMQRRQVGAQLGPRNAALSGYMMGQ